jgi:hypothetical protein
MENCRCRLRNPNFELFCGTTSDIRHSIIILSYHRQSRWLSHRIRMTLKYALGSTQVQVSPKQPCWEKEGAVLRRNARRGQLCGRRPEGV